jgi:hypothetical protein
VAVAGLEPALGGADLVVRLVGDEVEVLGRAVLVRLVHLELRRL